MGSPLPPPDTVGAMKLPKPSMLFCLDATGMVPLHAEAEVGPECETASGLALTDS